MKSKIYQNFVIYDFDLKTSLVWHGRFVIIIAARKRFKIKFKLIILIDLYSMNINQDVIFSKRSIYAFETM